MVDDGIWDNCSIATVDGVLGSGWPLDTGRETAE